MNVLFRADASTRIGTGHVVRCLTLADRLRDRGAFCRFVTRAHPGHGIGRIADRGFPVVELPAGEYADHTADADYPAWLGVPVETDAEETLGALGDDRPDWLVVDHYSLGAGWESRLAPRVGAILAIDDLGTRAHACDLLLDQNYASAPDRRYPDLPPGARRLLGPRYALLRPEYARERERTPRAPGPVRRVLVYLGGSDPFDTTGLALDTLSGPDFRHLEVDLVVGPNHPGRERLIRHAGDRPLTRVHGPRPHLADLMAAADLAIGAGGGTTWERFALGLPSVVISIAENQRAGCRALAADGLIRYVGHAPDVSTAALADALLDLLRDETARAALSRAGARLVDARGAERVASAMADHPGAPRAARM